MEVLELIFQHVLCLPPLEQLLCCVQMWHSLAVTEVSPRSGDGMLCVGAALPRSEGAAGPKVTSRDNWNHLALPFRRYRRSF